MPHCSDVSNALEKFTGVIASTTEQQLDLRSSRRLRDQQDLERSENWIENHSPFNKELGPKLVSLSSDELLKLK